MVKDNSWSRPGQPPGGNATDIAVTAPRDSHTRLGRQFTDSFGGWEIRARGDLAWLLGNQWEPVPATMGRTKLPQGAA
jgi:hypothetical protein